jgi:GNAT superfamily N-acetyltransferase
MTPLAQTTGAVSRLDEDYIIETFVFEERHYEETVALLRSAFLEHRKGGGEIVFLESTLRLMYGSPGQDSRLFVRAIHRRTGEVVGFMGAEPRTLAIGGERFRLCFPGCGAVHAAHRRRGIAARALVAVYELARSLGYDGAIYSFEPQAHGIDVARSLMRDLGYGLHDLFLIEQFLVRVLDVSAAAAVVGMSWPARAALRLLESVPRVDDEQVRELRPDDWRSISARLEERASRSRMALVWQPPEVRWYLGQPGVVGAVHEEGGEIRGFITAWEMALTGSGRTASFGWVDLVDSEQLSPKATRQLLRFVCGVARQRGWVGLHLPRLPSLDTASFVRAKFVPYPKKLLVTIAPFRPMQVPADVDSFQFSWR